MLHPVKPGMVKFANYYYDQETGHIITDRKFRQHFGPNGNAVDVKPNTEYTFSFEYYCTPDCTRASAIYQLPPDKHIWKENGYRGIVLAPGRHRFEGSFITEADQSEFMLGVCQGTQGDLYVWNFELYEKGEQNNLFVNPFFKDKLNCWDYPRSTVDPHQPLGQIQLLDLDNPVFRLDEGGFLPPEGEDSFYTFPVLPLTEVPQLVDVPPLENTAILWGKRSSVYDAEAEELRREIVDSVSVIGAGGETRYVSDNGCDENDGKTPETAWKTIEKVNIELFDTVLFRRGDVFRGSLELRSNTSYGAYGFGPKPCFYTGMRNYANPNLWIKTPVEHIWALYIGKSKDVGNLIFDYGKHTGIKLLKSYKNLKGNYQFYHHAETETVYLYYDCGNPGEMFDSIEVAAGHGMHGSQPNTHNVKIDNICVRYAGLHGIQFTTGATDITITNCEIGYIGGGMTQWGRLGNCIEFVNTYSNCTVDHCWLYQGYDTGYSFQNCSPANKDICFLEDRMVLKNCLIEYCLWNIEIFGPSTGLVTNSAIEKNICRFAGYGWGTKNRIGSSPDSSANLNLYKGIHMEQINAQNFVIRENIFDTGRYFVATCAFPNDAQGRGPRIVGNAYAQKKASGACSVMTSQGTPASQKRGSAAGESEFRESLTEFDLSPSRIVLY